MNPIVEFVRCPRCGDEMDKVGSNHWHCNCGCCLWDNMQLTWHQPTEHRFRKEIVQ